MGARRVGPHAFRSWSCSNQFVRTRKQPQAVHCLLKRSGGNHVWMPCASQRTHHVTSRHRGWYGQSERRRQHVHDPPADAGEKPDGERLLLPQAQRLFDHMQVSVLPGGFRHIPARAHPNPAEPDRTLPSPAKPRRTQPSPSGARRGMARQGRAWRGGAWRGTLPNPAKPRRAQPSPPLKA